VIFFAQHNPLALCIIPRNQCQILIIRENTN